MSDPMAVDSLPDRMTEEQLESARRTLATLAPEGAWEEAIEKARAYGSTLLGDAVDFYLIRGGAILGGWIRDRVPHQEGLVLTDFKTMTLTEEARKLIEATLQPPEAVREEFEVLWGQGGRVWLKKRRTPA